MPTKNQKIIKYQEERIAQLEHELYSAKHAAISLLMLYCGFVANVNKTTLHQTVGEVLFEGLGLGQKKVSEWEPEQVDTVEKFLMKLTMITGETKTPSFRKLSQYFIDLEYKSEAPN